MAASIPERFKDLLAAEAKAFASFATVMSDGRPQVTPVWFDYDGRHFLVNSARGRVKDRNVERNPKVALCITDPANPYRHLAIQGRVVAITEEGGDAHIDSLAKKYLGQDRYPGRKPDEVRVIYRIEPDRVATMG